MFKIAYTVHVTTTYTQDSTAYSVHRRFQLGDLMLPKIIIITYRCHCHQTFVVEGSQTLHTQLGSHATLHATLHACWSA